MNTQNTPSDGQSIFSQHSCVRKENNITDSDDSYQQRTTVISDPFETVYAENASMVNNPTNQKNTSHKRPHFVKIHQKTLNFTILHFMTTVKSLRISFELLILKEKLNLSLFIKSMILQ